MVSHGTEPRETGIIPRVTQVGAGLVNTACSTVLSTHETQTSEPGGKGRQSP